MLKHGETLGGVDLGLVYLFRCLHFPLSCIALPGDGSDEAASGCCAGSVTVCSMPDLSSLRPAALAAPETGAVEPRGVASIAES